MFIRSIRGLHPSKFLELCIIWIGIGVENNLSMSNFIACLENENIIKGLRPLSHSLRLRTVHAAIVCLGSSFRMIGFFKCSQTDKTITHACVSVSVWCDMSWLMMNYSCYIHMYSTIHTTTLSRTVTETARTQEGKSHGGRGQEGVGRSGSGRLNRVMNALSKLRRNFANRATFL